MIHKLLVGLFVLFAAFQINDPDYFIWVPIYLIIAISIFFYDREKYSVSVFLALFLIYCIGMASYYPEVISWIQNGTPSIASSMQAESPFIEFIREFFGLGICALALGVYTFLSNKKSKSL